MSRAFSEDAYPVTLFLNPLLRTKAQQVVDFSANLRQEAERMGQIMQEKDGIGIAAQQCGCLAHLALVRGEKEILPLVNGKITEHSDTISQEEEGCLSLPGWSFVVPRYDAIRLQAQDLEGKSFEVELSGWSARVVQHELDHLSGRLVFDYLPVFEKISFLHQLQEMPLLKEQEERETTR